MCRIDDCESSSFSTSVTRKARKTHKCDECHRGIARGERYQYSTLGMEGTVCTFKMCQHCQIGAQWLVQNCGGYVFDQVCEEIEEHAGEYPYLADRLREMASNMKRQWQGLDGLMSLPALPPPISVSESLTEVTR